MVADCYVALAMAAAATTRLKLGTGVTNSFTRHPAVTAGADAERTRSGMNVAREARSEAGLEPEIPFAAYLPLAVADDPEEAMRIGAGQVSLFARFSNMYGEVVGPVSDEQRSVLGAIHDAYDMHAHGRPGSAQASAVTPDFERNFGVFGPPDYCVQRLGELIESGIDQFILRGSPLDPSNPDSESSARFMSEVASQLRG